MLKKITTNALYLFLGDVGARLLGFLATMHIARSLGKEYFGLVVIALSVVSYAHWLADMGMATLGTRELARPFQTRTFHLRDFLIVKFLTATGVFLLFQFGITFIDLPTPLLPLLRLYLLFLFLDAGMLEWYSKAIQRYAAVAVARWISGGFYLAGVYWMVHTPQDYLKVPVFYLGGLFGAALLFYLTKKREDSLRGPLSSFAHYLSLLKSASSIGMATFFAQVVQLLPPLMLGVFYNASEAGIYGAAVKIIFVFQLIDRVFVALFLPNLSRVWAIDPKKIPERLQIILKSLLWFTLSLAVMIIFYSFHLIHLIFGDPYLSGTPVLSVLSGFIVFTVLNSVFSFTLIATGRQHQYFRGTARGSLMAIGCIVLFSALWGARGAAVGVVLGEFSIAMLVYLEFRRFFPMTIWKSFLTGTVYSSLFLGGLSILGVTTPWFAPLFWGIYVLGGWLLSGIRWQHLKKLFQL